MALTAVSRPPGSQDGSPRHSVLSSQPCMSARWRRWRGRRPPWPWRATPEEALGAIEELARKRTAQVLDPLDIPWTFQVRAGDPAAELEQAAGEQRADLIVVGSQGHTVVERLLLGSVSTRLTHHAQRPVMVVPLT